ncbi:MAG: IS66-like element accessory protein TnpA [Parvularculaceae bacterium]
MGVDVSTSSNMDTKTGRRTHKRWPEALKREIVAATMAPGASVSVVARRYDVNANQVFGWRRKYGSVIDAAAAPSRPPRPRLVELTVARETAEAPPASAAAAVSDLAVCDLIEIEIAGAYRVRVGANFDGCALLRVIDCLARR